MSFLCALDQQGFTKFVVMPQLLPQIKVAVPLTGFARIREGLCSIAEFDCPRVPVDTYDLQGPEWWALEVVRRQLTYAEVEKLEPDMQRMVVFAHRYRWRGTLREVR